MSLGSIVVRLTMNTADFETDAGRAAKVADKRAKEINASFKKAGVVIGTALSAAAIGLTAMVKGAIDSADAMRDLSIRVGTDTETLSAYGYAATQTGTDIETLGKGLKTLATYAADSLNPISEQAKVFKSLGIEADDGTGKLRSMSELIPQIADRFRAMEDGTTKTALAVSLFGGRAGLQLIEFLNQGSSGLAEFTERARQLGLIVDSETAAAADDFNDTLGDLKAVSQGYALHLAKELLPDLQSLAGAFTDTATEGNKVKEMAEDTAGFLRGLAAVAHGVSSAFEIVGTAIATLHMQGQAVGEFLFRDMARGMAMYRTASEGLSEELDEAFGRTKPEGGKFSNVQSRANTMSAVPVDTAAVARALSNPTAPKGPKAPKLTDEQKEAQRLLDTYDDMVASQLEQIALFGATTEAARVRYATEHGDLKDLSQAQKDVLISNAEYQDQLADTAALEEVWADAAQEQTDRVIASWNSATDELSVFAEQAGRNMQDAFADFLFDPFEEGLDGMLEGFADILQRMMAEWLASQLFNSMGEWGKANSGGDGWKGTLATIVGKFFGGGRAGGGGVDGSKLYEVGEGGAPELFKQGSRTYLIPGNDGRVVPAVNSNFGAPPEGVGGGFKVVIENKGQPMRSTGAQMEAGANGMQQLRVFIEDVAAESVTRGGKVDRANRMAYGVQRQGYTSG